MERPRRSEPRVKIELKRRRRGISKYSRYIIVGGGIIYLALAAVVCSATERVASIEVTNRWQEEMRQKLNDELPLSDSLHEKLYDQVEVVPYGGSSWEEYLESKSTKEPVNVRDYPSTALASGFFRSFRDAEAIGTAEQGTIISHAIQTEGERPPLSLRFDSWFAFGCEDTIPPINFFKGVPPGGVCTIYRGYIEPIE